MVGRLRFHPRRAADRGAHYCGSEHRFIGQPPTRIGRSTGRAELCGPRKLEVSQHIYCCKTVSTSSLENRNLSEALPQVEQLRQKMKAWPPVVGTKEKTPRQALVNVMDDELGYD